MSSDRSEVKVLLEEWSDAIRRKDIERLMTVYALEIVYFDCVAPLQIVGHEAVRQNFLRWFEMWEGPIGIEIRDQKITQERNLAAAYMMHRTYGTLTAGKQVDYWLRVSVLGKKSSSGWRLTHEHVSVPIDFAKGTALMDLQP